MRRAGNYENASGISRGGEERNWREREREDSTEEKQADTITKVVLFSRSLDNIVK
jgi:hypothetical protein